MAAHFIEPCWLHWHPVPGSKAVSSGPSLLHGKGGRAAISLAISALLGCRVFGQQIVCEEFGLQDLCITLQEFPWRDMRTETALLDHSMGCFLSILSRISHVLLGTKIQSWSPHPCFCWWTFLALFCKVVAVQDFKFAHGRCHLSLPRSPWGASFLHVVLVSSIGEPHAKSYRTETFNQGRGGSLQISCDQRVLITFTFIIQSNQHISYFNVSIALFSVENSKIRALAKT